MPRSVLPVFLSSLCLVATVLIPGCQDRAEIRRTGTLETSGSGQSSAGGPVTGIIDVAEALKPTLRPTDTLYIFARAGDSGPPAAVRRLGPGEFQFPYSYQLSADDMMIRQPGTAFSGSMKVFARISRSGDALGAPGDLEGYYPGGMVEPPAKGIDFTIATERM